MFAEERHQEILRQLQSNGSVRVKDLSSAFSVTEDCIRKDLTFLEKRELLRRTYGGAVLQRKNTHLYEVKERKQFDIDIKKHIAKKAFALLTPGISIFLDISTSNIELAKLIIDSKMNITVVSNMLEVVQLFCVDSVANFICAGGTFNDTYDGFDGSLCVESIARFKFDISFIGNVGIDVDNNKIYTYSHEDGITKAAVIAASRKPYILSQESKFSEDGNYCFASLEQVEGLILDKLPGKRTQKALADMNILIIA